MQSEPRLYFGKRPNDNSAVWISRDRSDFTGVAIQTIKKLPCGLFVEIAHSDGKTRPDQTLQCVAVFLLLLLPIPDFSDMITPFLTLKNVCRARDAGALPARPL